MRSLSRFGSRRTWWVAVAVSGMIVLFCHFRPWEVGLLEEWGFADTWNRLGWSALVSGAGADAGRPLQAIVFYLPLSFGLGITGVQFFLGLVALGQFFIVLWLGVADGGKRRWLFLIVALIVSLHPLWPAGFILRFLGAQFAVLTTVAALALLYRYLSGGRAWLLAPSAALAVTGLLAYQAPAAVLPLLALALSIMLPSASKLRRVSAALVTILAVALALLWSTVVAPIMAPGGTTYESSLLGGSGRGAQGLKTILHSIARIPITLLLRAPATMVAVAVLLVVLFALHRRIGMTRRVTLTLAAVTVLAIVSGVPYAVNSLHVLDPERVGGPAALTLELVVTFWCLLSPPSAIRLQTNVLGTLLIATGVATAISLTYWGRYSAIQRSMLNLIGPAVRQASGDQKVLIEDGSGVLGDVYTGFYPDLSSSSHVYNNDPTNVVMCTSDGVTRQHPAAAIYPLTTTKYCSTMKRPDAHLEARGEIAGGPVEVYIIGSSTGQGK